MVLESVMEYNITELAKVMNFTDIPDINVNFNILQTNLQSIEDFKETLQIIIQKYWYHLRGEEGLSVKQLDTILILITFSRFIILTIRYNIKTSLAISAITIVTAYVWYSSFLTNLFFYEDALYKYALTFKLGMDSAQIKTILEGELRRHNYDIRFTNPIGILVYAFKNGIVHKGYRIDPISMIVLRITTFPEKFTFIPEFIRNSLEAWYYLVTTQLIPLGARVLEDLVEFVQAFGSYTFITRVNKRLCPYLLRWHWTMLMTFKFLEPVICNTAQRISIYSEEYVLSKIEEAEELYMMRLPLKELEWHLLQNFVLCIIIFHLGFLVYGMLHAAAGQYFYLPIFTKTTEMHIGPRDKLSVYSGGDTAWQNEAEKNKKRLLPKFWYGWFGRGTDKPNILSYAVQKLLFKPIYKVIKKIFKFIRRK